RATLISAKNLSKQTGPALKYWKEHNGPKGEKYYTGRGNNGVPHQGGGHCPPGQAKKGNC
ncbi:MAG: hypothetical protein ABTQ26_20205, partial [Azonexus sp.]